ncbi:MAG: ROK family protein [Sphingomonadaceae bacterium]
MTKEGTLRHVIAIDVGGTRFRVALATAEGAIEWRTSRPTEAERGPQAVLGSIFEAVDEALAVLGDRSGLLGFGVGVPGPLDPWAGVVHNPPNLPGWDSVPVKDLFEERYGLPTLVGNDANLAAVGEHGFGAGRNCRNMVYVTVSTGIGGGVIADDRLLLGHGGYAGEIGHMTIDLHGPVCHCGNRGCLEVLASGTAIARRARELLRSGAESTLKGLPAEVTAKDVVEAADRGDGVARLIVQEAAVALGVGMVNVAHLFNPRRIIIGGGVSNAGPLLWDPMLETVRTRTMPPNQRDLEIVPAGLGDDAGLLGAVAMVTRAR